MKKTLTVLLLILSCSILTLTAQTWTKMADFPGLPRNLASSFVIGHYAFVGCGINLSGSTNYSDFYKWNQHTNTWSAITAYPGAGQNADICFTIEGKGYVGLGFNGNGKTDFWRFDTISNSWTSMAAYPGAGRYAASYFVIGHKAYVLGGSQGGAPYLQDVWMYDAHTNAWTAKSNYPGGKIEGMFAFTIGNRAYVGGGFDGTNYISSFWEYDTTNDTWTSAASFPFILGGEATGFVLGRKAYVADGWTTLAFHMPLGYIYDTATKAWSSFTNLGTNGIERYYAMSFRVGNYGYICTGTDSTGGASLNDLWQYSDNNFLSTNDIQVSANQQINLYPNPANSNVNLVYSSLSNGKNIVTLTDITGRIINTINLQGTQGCLTIPVSNLANGMYFYSVLDEQQHPIKAGKLIVTH